MKIISKWKDYYDYLQGVYGIDPLMVYDRRGDTARPDIPSDTLYMWDFAICNKEYLVYEYKGKFYNTPEQYIELNSILKADNKERLTVRKKDYYVRTPIETLENAQEKWKRDNEVPTDANKKYRQPVLVRSSYARLREDVKWKVPHLELYGFASFYPAEKIYQEISSFLGWLRDYPEIPNKQTDTEKLVSHGFDKKVSFRHRK
jgi:hypothetical protein